MGAQRADAELLAVLQEMLDADEAITGRQVAARMATLEHSSSISRNPWRAAQLARAQADQAARRKQAALSGSVSRERLVAEIAALKATIQGLEHDRDILVSFIPALVRSALEHGGMRRVLAFYQDYQAALARLTELGVLPNAAAQPLHAVGVQPGGSGAVRPPIIARGEG